jgi:hypothetical protein
MEACGNNLFTVAQLAAALDVSKPTAAGWLGETQPSGQGAYPGAAWSIDVLPAKVKEGLATQATRNGMTIAGYLESSARPWQPKVPLTRVSPKWRQKAEKLRAAMLPTWERQRDSSVNKSEIQQLGLEDYKQVFGHGISPDTWRKLKARTLRRSRWDDDLARLEIYLDEDASEAAGAVQTPTIIRDELRPLRALIEGILKNGSSGVEQRGQIWDAAFLVVEDLSADGLPTAKSEVVRFLVENASFMADNPVALRRNFDRLYGRWKDNGKALAVLDDKRNGRPRGPELTNDEITALIAYSARYGGGRDQGWREAIRAGKLRPEVVSYYANSPRQMPRKIRERLTEGVDDAKRRLHGIRHAGLTGASMRRNPNHPANPLHSGDWDQCDDMTFVNVMWDKLPDGSLYVGQPQLLLWVDERSWLPLAFVLIPDRGYNAFDIRNSWTAKCDEHGVPRDGLYLEGSFWQTARAWVGRRDEVSWSETEQGIRRLGLRIKHARYAKGKIIERVFGKIQNLLQAEPGYVGRNATTDRYEDVQKQIRLVKSGQAHPAELFLSKAEWKLRLGELLVEYSNEPTDKDTIWLDGLTPLQAYEKYFSTPLVKIPENSRYLLACNKIEGKRIGINGLSFQFGNRSFTYKDERLGVMRIEGQKVICWFNPENPETCGVTDMNGENPIVVKRDTALPCHDAPRELMSQAKRENAAMERPAKEVYAAVKTVFASDFETRRFRSVISDGVGSETAAEFSRQEEELTAGEREKQTLIRTAARSGLARLRPDDPNLERRAQGAAILAGLGIGSAAARRNDIQPESEL